MKNISLPIINLNGSRHALFYKDGIIQIGCENYSVEKWMTNYKSIGADNGYSNSEISEYYEYIKIISTIVDKQKEVKNAI